MDRILEPSNGREPGGGGEEGTVRVPAQVSRWEDAGTSGFEREPGSLSFGSEGVMTLGLGPP